MRLAAFLLLICIFNISGKSFREFSTNFLTTFEHVGNVRHCDLMMFRLKDGDRARFFN